MPRRLRRPVFAFAVGLAACGCQAHSKKPSCEPPKVVRSPGELPWNSKYTHTISLEARVCYDRSIAGA